MYIEYVYISRNHLNTKDFLGTTLDTNTVMKCTVAQ